MKYSFLSLQESAKLEFRNLETTITTSAGWTPTLSCREATGAGLMPGTTAGNAAWTLYLLRHLRNMTGSRALWTVRIVITCFDVLTIQRVKTCHNNQGEKYQLLCANTKKNIRHSAHYLSHIFCSQCALFLDLRASV